MPYFDLPTLTIKESPPKCIGSAVESLPLYCGHHSYYAFLFIIIMHQFTRVEYLYSSGDMITHSPMQPLCSIPHTTTHHSNCPCTVVNPFFTRLLYHIVTHIAHKYKHFLKIIRYNIDFLLGILDRMSHRFLIYEEFVRPILRVYLLSVLVFHEDHQLHQGLLEPLD